MMRAIALMLVVGGWLAVAFALRSHHHIVWEAIVLAGPLFWVAGYFTGHNAARLQPRSGWRLAAYRFLVDENHHRRD